VLNCLWDCNICATILGVGRGPVVPYPSPGMNRNHWSISRWARPLCSLRPYTIAVEPTELWSCKAYYIQFLQSVGRRKGCNVSCCFSVWNVWVWVKLRIFMIAEVCERNWIEVVPYVWPLFPE
jgi:hypothetical protein